MIQNSCPSKMSFIIDPHVKLRGGGAKAAPMIPLPIALFPVTHRTSNGLRRLEEQCLPRLDRSGRCRERIGLGQEFLRRLGRLARLRTNSSLPPPLGAVAMSGTPLNVTFT